MSGRVIGVGVAAAMFLIAAVGALVLNMQRLHETYGWVEHENAVLHEIARFETALLRAESGERGYVLSGERSYLESYRHAAAEVGDSLKVLDRLMAGNADQTRRLGELRGVAQARLGEFARVVALGPERREEALTALGAARVSQFTRLARARIDDLTKAERSLLEDRQDQANRVTGQLTMLAGVMTVLAVLGTAFAAYLLERQHALAQVHAVELRTRELQAELLRMSRLSNMGEMASALAHELNQPLAALANYIQGSRRLLGQRDDEQSKLLKDALLKANEQAQRAGQVIRRLREFVARGENDKRIESLRMLVDEASALAMLGARDDSVQLRLALDPAADRILVDKIQIQQVLLNLMRNGIEAMRESSRRELTVASARVAGGMVAVNVSDTGSGIAEETAATLFEPFRSTKENGLGVGLSISRTIVEAHGGRIDAKPNPGGGTIFAFTVPSAGAHVQ
ncbi:MAG: CHASE3 domain-containing protein [Proteobacteria bacterium]|nr:CHASE3 domain-containing protein [Pseudomonadota bacterium]